jgi:hypothetical protein
LGYPDAFSELLLVEWVNKKKFKDDGPHFLLTVDIAIEYGIIPNAMLSIVFFLYPCAQSYEDYELFTQQKTKQNKICPEMVCVDCGGRGHTRGETMGL